MILTNTVTQSVTLNGTASSATMPADEAAPLGYMPGSNGQSWVALPGPIMAINALGALTATGATLDWSSSAYYSFTAYAGAFSLVFSNVTIGQMIRIRITAASNAACTWSGSTISWVGTAHGGAGSASAPVLTTYANDITLVCTGLNTYDGTYTTV
jgi:hypothetical protein